MLEEELQALGWDEGSAPSMHRSTYRGVALPRLRHLAAVEAARGSFDPTVDASSGAPGCGWGSARWKQWSGGPRGTSTPSTLAQSRLSAEAAVGPQDPLVLSLDNKGIVMLHKYLLRQRTPQVRESALQRREEESQAHGHGCGGPRPTPQARGPEDVLAELRPVCDVSTPRPRAKNKDLRGVVRVTRQGAQHRPSSAKSSIRVRWRIRLTGRRSATVSIQ